MTRTGFILATGLMLVASATVRAQDSPFALVGDGTVGGSCPGTVTVRLKSPEAAKAGAEIFLTKRALGTIPSQESVPGYDRTTGNTFDASFDISDPKWCGLQVAVQYQNPRSEISKILLVNLPAQAAVLSAVSLITREVSCGIPTSIYFTIKGELSPDAAIEVGGKTAALINPNLAAVQLQYPCGKDTKLKVSCTKCALGDPQQVKVLDTRLLFSGGKEQMSDETQNFLAALILSIFCLIGLAISVWWSNTRFALISQRSKLIEASLNRRLREFEQTFSSARVEPVPAMRKTAPEQPLPQPSGQADPAQLWAGHSPAQREPRQAVPEVQVIPAVSTLGASAVPEQLSRGQAEPMAEAVWEPGPVRGAQRTLNAPTSPSASSLYLQLSPWQRLVDDYNQALGDQQSQRGFEQEYVPTRIAISNLEDVTSRSREPVFADNDRGDLFLISIDPDFYLVPTFDHPWQGDFVRNWSHSFVIEPGAEQRLVEPAETTKEAGYWTVKQKGRLTRVS